MTCSKPSAVRRLNLSYRAADHTPGLPLRIDCRGRQRTASESAADPKLLGSSGLQGRRIVSSTDAAPHHSALARSVCCLPAVRTSNHLASWRARLLPLSADKPAPPALSPGAGGGASGPPPCAGDGEARAWCAMAALTTVTMDNHGAAVASVGATDAMSPSIVSIRVEPGW